MTPDIIYHERIGGGDDTEGNRPDGVVVTLSYWYSDDWKAPSHYIRTARVMLDREIVVDEIEVMRTYLHEHSKHIRQSIARFDQLVELNPIVNNEINQQ